MRLPLATLLCLSLAGGSLGADSEVSRAAIAGDLPRLIALAEAGKDVNALDRWGWTPLLWATFYQQDTAMRWLLAKGADPNIAATQPYRSFAPGARALTVAAYYGFESGIAILMDGKADPSLADAKGVRPADLARQFGFVECLARLEGKVKAPEAARPAPATIGRITPVVIVLGSGSEMPDAFLTAVQNSLAFGLEDRKIQFTFFRQNPLALDEEKALAAQVASTKARFVLTLWEGSGTLRKAKRLPWQEKTAPMRLEATFEITLRASGSPDVLWSRSLTAHDSKQHSPFGPAEDVARVFATALQAELEADHLL